MRFLRIFTFYSPIAKGKHRVYLVGLKFCQGLPTHLKVKIKDGRKFSVNLSTGMQTTVFFLGEYEKTITDIITPLLRKGDVSLDVGANFGWYTTLFHKYGQISGEVHSFEPMMPSFQELEKNYDLMNNAENVHINNLALGDKEGEIEIYLFPEMSTGHASLSKKENDNYISYKCRMATLDTYLKKNNVADINFLKIDIEGAEMLFLKGAEKLFKQKIPPIWLMEMALQQTKNFDYFPDDILKFMSERPNYDFYKIDEINAKLIKIEEFKKDDIGANVICFPKNHYPERFAAIQNFIE